MATDATTRIMRVERAIQDAQSFLGYPRDAEAGILALPAAERADWAARVAALVDEHAALRPADIAFVYGDSPRAARALARYEDEDLPHLRRFAAWVAEHCAVAAPDEYRDAPGAGPADRGPGSAGLRRAGG